MDSAPTFPFPPADDQPRIAPEPTLAASPRDRVAVALGNASLLGVGYLMSGRRLLACFSTLTTVVLLFVLVSDPSVWLEFVVLLWWAAMITHGWWLAGRRPVGARRLWPLPVRTQRIVGACLAMPVLLAFGLLRFDAARIDGALAEARQHGSCAQAVRALDRIWLGHWMANAPLTAHNDKTAMACQRLHAAKGKLSGALADGDKDALASGFDDLAWVLARRPGHRKMVDSVLDRFLAGLPSKEPCGTVTITDWSRERKPTRNTLDRAADVVPRIAPAALVKCGNYLMAAEAWESAQSRYEQLLDEYPDSKHAGTARKGISRAKLAIQLKTVNNLLDTESYCSTPEKYERAPAYRKGTNKSQFLGNDTYSDQFPDAWRATTTEKTALIVCLGDATSGSVARTCPYQRTTDGSRFSVTFHRIAVPVEVYELRTGKRVLKKTVQINGTSCPASITYTEPGVPPSSLDVEPSEADVRRAFKSLIVR